MVQIRELLDIRGYKLQGAAPFDDLNFYVRPKGWGMHMHSHEHMQFLVVLEGALYVSIEKRVYLLTAGGGYLVPPGAHHRLWTESGYTQVGANFYLRNRSDLMGIAGRMIDLRLEPMVFERLAFAERAGRIETLLSNGSAIDVIKASTLICEGLTEVLERLEYGEHGRIDSRITEYLEAHIADRLRVETIARHFCMSPTQLQRICHRFFGMSVMELYSQKRLNKARVLLRSTESSIGEIAWAVGFEETANFSAFFTKKTNMTPSRYRTLKGRTRT